MSSIKKILKELGLTETESAVYAAGLSKKAVTAHDLMKETGIRRTTVYHALETLIQKGFASKVEKGAQRFFLMARPEQLEKFIAQEVCLLKNRGEALKDILPLLELVSSRAVSDVAVHHYEGVRGIKMVMEEALWCRSKKWDIVAPRENFFSEFDDEYARYFLETRKEHRITARSLWERDPSRRVLSAEEIAARNPRFLPQVMHGKFRTVIILFDNKIAFISSLKTKTAVLIESKELFDTMSSLFEGLWTGAEKYMPKK